MEMTLRKKDDRGTSLPLIQYGAALLMAVIAILILYVGKKTPVLVISAVGLQTVLATHSRKRVKVIAVVIFGIICAVCIAAGWRVGILKGLKLSAISALLGILIAAFNRPAAVPAAPTGREQLVVTDFIQDKRWITMLEDVLRGDPYKSIAIDFNISESAVKKVMTKVYKRFDVTSREELIKKCSACDVVFPDKKNQE